jgi:hypothetical protein
VNYVSNWCVTNKLTLNKSKNKILPICKHNVNLYISQNYDIVSEFVYLGMYFNSSLSFDSHVKFVTTVCSKRLYALRILKPLLCKQDLVLVYFSVIRSMIEYSAQTFCGLNNKLNSKLQSIQRRAHNIVCHKNCHCDIFISTFQRRNLLTERLFSKIVKNCNHPLRSILPTQLPSGRFCEDYCRTSRRQNSFIFYATHLYNAKHIR